jgi:hypothetical protein
MFEKNSLKYNFIICVKMFSNVFSNLYLILHAQTYAGASYRTESLLSLFFKITNLNSLKTSCIKISKKSCPKKPLLGVFGNDNQPQETKDYQGSPGSRS